MEHRPDYGKRKSSPINIHAQGKICSAYTHRIIDPFAVDVSDKGTKLGYNNLLPCLCHKIGCSMGPHGQKEPRALTYSSFEYGVEDKVLAYMGLRYIHLKTFNSANKTCKLSLTNLYQYEMGSFLKMWDNRKDPINVVNLFFYYVETHLKPAMDYYKLKDVPFWNRRAPQKELRVRYCNLLQCFCLLSSNLTPSFYCHIEMS